MLRFLESIKRHGVPSVKSVGRRCLDKILIGWFPALSVRLSCHVLNALNIDNRLPSVAVAQVREILRDKSVPLDDNEGRASSNVFVDDQQECYSQEGEDLIISRIVGYKTNGFYVDVGAHHPTRHSNTFLLYRRGWRGINIDATPGSMELFRQIRPRDINLECMVATDVSPRLFYILSVPELNTASQKLAHRRRNENRRYEITETVTLKPRTLAAILDEHLPDGLSIDIMSIDVEGLDLDVLRSNDWHYYRPTILLVELLNTKLEELDQNEIVQFLRRKSYHPIAKLYNTVIFH